MAWASLGANKLRSALTTSGIMIGIFSVISVMTTISAMQTQIETGLTFLGSNVFQISKYPGTFSTFGDDHFKNRRDISYQDYLSFEKLMGDTAEMVCPKVFQNGGQAFYQNKKTNPNLFVCGTNTGFAAANNLQIDEGRNLSPQDVEYSRAVCVIGHQLVQRLFPSGGAVGQKLRINNKEYEVVGTFAAKGGGFGASDDSYVAIPVTRFFENYGTKNRSINIAVRSKNQIVYERTLGFAIGAFRKARGLRAEEPPDFEVYGNDSLSGAFHNMAGIIRTGALVISTIALVAAGVGIMNIMLVSVTERTKEIGVRKSLGARQRDIRLQFLLEALFLSLLGATAGIILGVVAGNFVAVWFHAGVIFPWGWTLAGVAVCSAIGIGFGLYPAHRAASLDPIEALRFE